MSVLGYVRVSTQEQNEQSQVKLLQELKVDKVFIDKCSGKDTNRPQLKALLEYIREGDVVVVNSISRFARNTKDLLLLIDDLKSKKVEFKSLKENIDTTTPAGKFMLTIFGAVAELERDYIRQRQKEGIAVAKDNGKHLGRPQAEINNEFKKYYKLWKNGELKAVEAMKKAGYKKTTWYALVNQYEDSKG